VKTSNFVYAGFDNLATEECINFLAQSLSYWFNHRKRKPDENFFNWASYDAGSLSQGLLVPLQVGLSVQLYHLYASRFLIDTLHQCGFCCFYNEVHQFEQNVVEQTFLIPHHISFNTLLTMLITISNV